MKTLSIHSSLVAFCLLVSAISAGKLFAAIPPLPEGNNGIAASYPNDANIQTHADVLFSDDFESYTSASQLRPRWNDFYQSNLTRIATESGNFYAGGKGLEFTLPAIGEEESNAVIKNISPTQDKLFVRVYTKFESGYNIPGGSNHNGVRIAAQYPGPGSPPDGTDFFLFLLENSVWYNEALPGYTHIYVYHPEQRSQWGDYWNPNGTGVPGGISPSYFGPDFVARPHLIPQTNRWYSYELMVQANTPGQRDGRAAIWIDGILIADFPNLRMRDVATLKIDQIQLEFHANPASSSRANKKWYDNVVVAKSYIGPVNGGTPPAFNFSLANGGAKSVTPGASVTNSITATLVSGTAQSVTYSASGMPAGVSASFSPTGCSPTCSTTLTLTAGAGAAAGTIPITVTATGGSVSRTTNFNLTVQAIPDTTPPTVSITAPVNNATVTSPISISATASDNVAVLGVQFRVDGANQGAEDTSVPYSLSNVALSAGVHTITAVARDATGLTTTSSLINITVSGGGGNIINAASCAQAAVTTAINAAQSGDTVMVPAGTCSWSGGISLPSNKDLTLQGATILNCTGTPGTETYSCTATDNTNLTCNSGCFSIDLSANHRITGFTMMNSGNELISSNGAQNVSKHFRIDHNRLVSTGGWAPIRFKNNQTAVHPQGIWDHNRLEFVAIHTNGTLCQLGESCGSFQHAIWAEESPLGNSDKVVYLEANHFVGGDSDVNFTDGNYGMRVVIRFNRTQGNSVTAFEYHTPQGANRGSQRWETYHNAITDLDTTDDCYFGMALIRGGTGVFFGNSLSGAISGCNFSISIDNVRSERDPGGGVGACNGSSNWDQNSPGQQGWHCRDQIGIGRDLSLWNGSGAWNQEIKPAYFWNNTRSGSPVTATVMSDGLNTTHIQANRDYHEQSAAFNGTSGVGMGTIAQRPTSCTTGTGYWATDEGDWNSLQSGPDGRLYKCTATNTWTLYFTPYPYPHPWAGGLVLPPQDTTPPAKPRGLRTVP